MNLARRLQFGAVSLPPILHRYSFTSGLNDEIGSGNLTNVGVTVSGGYAISNGYTQYAHAVLDLYADKYTTYSAWIERVYTNTYYQYAFGALSYKTGNISEYSWWIGFYGNKLANVSAVRYDGTEPLNTPVHVVAVVNPILATLQLYRNKILVYTGALYIGTYATGHNTFSICGVSNSGGALFSGVRLHSCEIYDGIATQEQVDAMYQKGIL